MTVETKEVKERGSHARRSGRHGFLSGLVLGGLVGGTLVFGAITLAKVSAAGPMIARMAGHGHGAWRGSIANDPEAAREHLDFAVAWALDRVDATDEQKSQARAILGGTHDELWSLRDVHAQTRESFVTELSRPEVDREALEALRQSALETANEASRELIRAIAELSDVLTYEQRQALIEELRERGTHAH